MAYLLVLIIVKYKLVKFVLMKYLHDFVHFLFVSFVFVKCYREMSDTACNYKLTVPADFWSHL